MSLVINSSLDAKTSVCLLWFQRNSWADKLSGRFQRGFALLAEPSIQYHPGEGGKGRAGRPGKYLGFFYPWFHLRCSLRAQCCCLFSSQLQPLQTGATPIKHSSSAVDLVACVQPICQLWEKLHWPDPEEAFMLMVKITEVRKIWVVTGVTKHYFKKLNILKSCQRWLNANKNYSVILYSYSLRVVL